jgi:hypothetical protein
VLGGIELVELQPARSAAAQTTAVNRCGRIFVQPPSFSTLRVPGSRES